MQVAQELPHAGLNVLNKGTEEDFTTVPALVLLAAGLGSRFGGEKQFATLGPSGETLMDYALYDAVRAGIKQAVIIVQPQALAALPTLQRRYGGSIDVRMVAQRLDDLPPGFSAPSGRDRPWGTAHALRAVRRAVDGPFIVVNSDDFYGAHPYRALVAARGGGGHDPATWHLAGFALRDTLSPSGPVNRAVCHVGAGGTLVGLEEVRDISPTVDDALQGTVNGQVRSLAPTATVSMNMWGLSSACFDILDRSFTDFLTQADRSLGEYLLPDMVGAAIAQGVTVEVLPAQSRWCGVTFPEDAVSVRDHLADLTVRGEYPTPLWP